MENNDSLKKIKQEEKEKIKIQYSKSYEAYNSLLNIEENKRQRIEDEKNNINAKIEERKNQILQNMNNKSNESQILNNSIKDAINSKNIDELLSVIKNLP